MKGIAVGLALVASALVGCSSAPRAAEAEHAVAAESLSRAALTTLPSLFEAGGTVRARSSAPIASRIMAPITAVLVRPGDRVRRGAPLVTLDAREIASARDRASAAVDAARQSADAEVSDTRAAESAVHLARLTRDRLADLHAKRSATTQELDQANASLTTAEAQLTGALARSAAAAAARTGAEAALEEARIAATYAVLTAPFDGLISERHVDPGAMAIPGARLLTMEDAVAFQLEIRLDEARATEVVTGQRVDVNFSDTRAIAAWTAARVVEIARLDDASHAFVLKIEVPEATHVRSGQFGRARFQGKARQALTVPPSAVVHRGQLTFTFVAEADGAVRLRAVSVGTIGPEHAEVLAGVHEGERVVTNPPASLLDGAPVVGGGR